MLDVRPDDAMGALNPPAGCHRFAGFRMNAGKVDALGGDHELDGKNGLSIMKHLPGFECADGAHAVVIFLVRRCRDRVDACGMGENFIFGNHRGRRILRNHKAGIQAAVLCEEARQPTERTVHHALDPPLGDTRNLCQRDRKKIECKRQGLTVEIPSL